MFFRKKKQKKCDACGGKCSISYTFCPYCGNNIIDEQQEMREYGMLGRSDLPDPTAPPLIDTRNLGFTDKILASVMNAMIKTIDKQMKEQLKDMDKMLDNAEIQATPNGIKIRIASPMDLRQKQPSKNHFIKKGITEEQIKRMSELPRTKAKTSVKRLGDKVVYELSTPGVTSTDDIFVSKLESGYEVKVIADKKVYVNSIPINLPIRRYTLLKNKILMEFNAQED